MTDILTLEQAEKLARELRPEDTDEGLHYDDFRALIQPPSAEPTAREGE